MRYTREKNGITLVALVVTIVILLVLAGITISTLGGENGLLTRATQAKQAQIESEMKEQLTLALQDLQIEKLGNATLDDVTQEWIDSKIQNYECTVKEDASISGKRIVMEKNGVICKFVIDENLSSTVIEESESGAQLEYEAMSRDGDNVNILVTITDIENGLQQVEFPDGTILQCNGQKQVAKDYTVQLGVEYVVKMTSVGGQVKEEKILITDYYHTITKNFGEGISIDNNAIKAAYNKPYQATITAGNEYKIVTITVTMGGQTVAVDTTTGVINIEKVTGNIEITATAKKIEIETTTPIIGTTTTATTSVADCSQTRGTTLYINFNATIEGKSDGIIIKLLGVTNSITLPYAITKNSSYTFVIEGIYNGKIITKELEVNVNKYKSASDIVKYDAGDWTKDEIDLLKTSKLYDLNVNRERSSRFKLRNDEDINCTFGGFTYKEDLENQAVIDSGLVITSRNQSVSPERGTPEYDGWQILNKTTKIDDSGNTIKNEDGTDRIYVTKLIHCGSPENFTFQYEMTDYNDGERGAYILSSGISYSYRTTLADGKTIINPRNWDMYKDKEQLDLIDNVNCLTYNAGNIGAAYWLAVAQTTYDGMFAVSETGTTLSKRYTYGCYGVRPVVTMVDGVYIVSGEGTEASPYVLGKD